VPWLDEAIHSTSVSDFQADCPMPKANTLHKAGERPHRREFAQQNGLTTLKTRCEHATFNASSINNRTLG
jgi:hypothetical protein